jgi:hypothetical protein
MREALVEFDQAAETTELIQLRPLVAKGVDI